jgi:hypothetical protein
MPRLLPMRPRARSPAGQSEPLAADGAAPAGERGSQRSDGVAEGPAPGLATPDPRQVLPLPELRDGFSNDP